MSNLIKPYEIAVYEDVLQDGVFVEKRLGIIGSNEMTGLNRAIEPNLVRNVNGQSKFSFKMYKHYVDTITGEKVENPFADWLIAERKVKLKYGKHINSEGQEVDTWYDFIVKDINENSSNYLYTYQLEDANVQELSKNGFGVTLDVQLMNNIGTARELGSYVMEETDWSVDGDIVVQTVDEALVYLTVTSPIRAKHVLDQVAVNEEYPSGVTIDNALITLPAGTHVLAFYSSCKNKPHRFQFIYSNNGYGRSKVDGDYIYNIARKDDRTIIEKDCQYYIDFDVPDTDYPEDNKNTTYDLYLPKGFSVWEQGAGDSGDTTISSWYRGARYGYAQQAEYVPLLERYCQKFTKPKTFAINDTVVKPFDHEDAIYGNLTFNDNSVTYKKQKEYAGVYFDITYDNSEVYKLSYEVNNPSRMTNTLGGHAVSFEISQFDVKGSNNNGATWTSINVTPYHTPSLGVYNIPASSQNYNKYKVTAIYRKINKEGDGYPQIYIQPNIYTNESCEYKISNISFGINQNYYGYTDTEYVSPTLIQNCITNYDFKKTSGWTPTQTTKVSSNTKPAVESFYGRYVDNEFRSIVDDYLEGTYSDLITYTSYLKMEFKQTNQFILNSGIRDNRSIIDNMPEGEEWVLDYKIVDVNNDDVSNDFTYRLAEFIYDKESGGYSERTGSIAVGELDEWEFTEGDSYHRGVFKVNTNNYTEDEFKGKKGAKGTYLNLQIKPTNPTFSTDSDGNTIPLVYYIEHIALYRKVLDKNGDIIVPDYEAQESSAAQNYVDNSTLEYKYNYFNVWHVDDANPKKIVDKGALPLYTTDTLKYDIYKPVYNTGAQKVRSVTVKESNYFNILQSIAETFEQWLIIEINRDSSGAICPELNADGSIKNYGKKIKFKNYRGDNNYACFRYGVNLKDIQRTYSSKNIVTKLIVKQNTNELGKDGFCTIQRASANPTGENYIYDFQYLQNMEIMKADEYLTTNYYMTGAKGPDGVLWKEKDNSGTLKDVFMTTDSTYTLNGYFPRLKKINEAIMPLNQEIIGLNADLVKENAKKTVAEAEIEASLSGIEQTRLDFHALTGVYPEDAQDGTIESVSNINVTAQDNWYTAVLDTSSSANSVKFTAGNKDVQVTPRKILLTQGAEEVSISNGRYRIKSCGWDGLYVDYDYMHELTYLLIYDLEIITPKENKPVLSNIGCHNTSFENGFKITVKGINNDVEAEGSDDMCELTDGIDSGKYKVSVTGTFNKNADERSNPCLYIQPNRGIDTKIEYMVSNIKLYEVGTESGAESCDRTVAAYVNADILIKPSNSSDPYSITRTFEVEGKLPANATEIILPINITTVDLDRSDVNKYIEELTTYRKSHQNATKIFADIDPVIAAKEQAMELKNQLRKQYWDWKKQLNYLFFKRYSQFIQEGTWISEEHVDDEKYYADAQSVLYNSCYPQVAYTINTLELSQLPGYELFKFDLGDKTWAIDDEFFGVGKHEEVIVTELSEMLDDPSKNQIKVQNFKNQFQDLFQKITATVQQTQYNVGSYEKGDAFLNANAEKKAQFITDAINNAKSYLNVGQETVVSDNAGITITDKSDKKRQLRLVGGAILFSTEDPETKETTWRTGLTNEGISADLITAGRLDTGAIQIMSGDEPVFRWDAYGISAYDAHWSEVGGVSAINSIDTKKFVRFDKNGIYGVNHAENIDGASWHPGTESEIDAKATFALTWDGLKVTGEDGVVARIGKLDNNILNISRTESEEGQNVTKNLMSFSNDGSLRLAGFYINEKDITIYGKDEEGNDNNTVVGFISKGEQDGYYAVGESGLKQNWFLWNRGTEGETETDSDGQISGPKGTFGVDIDGDFYVSGDGQIGNWTLSGGKLYYNDNKILLSPNGIDVTVNDDETKKLVLKAGDDFYVDVNGMLYANAGQIGSMTIDAISNLPNQVVGKNLLLRSNYAPERTITSNDSKSGYGFSQSASQSTVVEFGRVTNLKLEKGVEYTVSFTAWIEGDDIPEGFEQLFECDLFPDSLPQKSGCKATTTPTRIEWKFSSDNDDLQDCALRFFSDQKTDGWYVRYHIYITDIKLEKGSSATDWCPADEDSVSANVNTSEFSWKFSPSEGMFMWNGAQHEANDIVSGTETYGPTRGAVFAIYNDNGTHKLSMKGHVEAESGNFGALKINETTLNGRTYLIEATSEYYSGSSGITYDGKVLFGPGGIFMSALGDYESNEGTYFQESGCYSIRSYNNWGLRQIGFNNATLFNNQLDSNGNYSYGVQIHPNGFFFNADGGYGKGSKGLHYESPTGGQEAAQVYLVDETGAKVFVNDLVFKGSHNIKIGDNVVGKVTQMGNFVCGYLISKAYQGCAPSKQELSIENNNIIGPASGHECSITWFSNAGDNPNGRFVRISKNTNGLLKIYVEASNKGDYDSAADWRAWNYDVGNAPGGHISWSYFCYTTNANTPIN